MFLLYDVFKHTVRFVKGYTKERRESMNNLAQQPCEACTPHSPRATDTEITAYMQQLPNWHITEHEGIKQLERTFTFENFVQALAFANRVGDLAEEAGHHPVILIEWGKASVSWWTHSIGGLHRNDFIMAARTDKAYTAL